MHRGRTMKGYKKSRKNKGKKYSNKNNKKKITKKCRSMMEMRRTLTRMRHIQ